MKNEIFVAPILSENALRMVAATAAVAVPLFVSSHSADSIDAGLRRRFVGFTLRVDILISFLPWDSSWFASSTMM